MKHLLLGRQGEKLAQLFLEKRGYKVIHQNWTCHWGEIDLIALENQELVFVEVKTLQSNDFLDPVYKLDAKKVRHLERSLSIFLAKHPEFVKNYYRLDLICLAFDTPKKKYLLKHYKNVSLY